MEKKIKNKKNFLHHKGFSFIESMLAVFLVSVGLVVALKLLTAGFKDSIDARDQFIASLLAQEGVELVRNIRDNNWVDNDPAKGSFACLSINPTTGLECLTAWRTNFYIDYTGNYACGPGIATGGGKDYYKMCLDSSNGSYENNKTGTVSCPSGTTETKFRRRIHSANNAADSVTITSIVTWSGNDITVNSSCSGVNLSNLSDSDCQVELQKCNTSNKCAYTQITLNKWGE